jgi:hypothetical protein
MRDIKQLLEDDEQEELPERAFIITRKGIKEIGVGSNIHALLEKPFRAARRAAQRRRTKNL